MLLLKLLFVTLNCYGIYGTQSSEELEALISEPLGATFAQNIMKRIYDEDKTAEISSWLKILQEVSNATLIGSQNIYGNNGEIVEIRTVELHIFDVGKNKDNTQIIVHKDDSNGGDEDFSRMANFVAKFGFPMETAAEVYDKTGKINNSLYGDAHLLYLYDEGIHLVNKTIETDTRKEVDDKIKELQAKNQLMGVFKFNADGQFLTEESNLIPDFIVSVVSVDGRFDQEMLDEAKKGLATIFLICKVNQHEIPSKLSEYLNHKYPQIDFAVFQNTPSAWYVSMDYEINLRYELTNWMDDPPDIIYTIFGFNKK